MANETHEGRIAAEWRAYREAALPSRIPLDVAETFQATFFSGAAAMFDLLMVSARLSAIDTEAAVVLTMALKHELGMYFDALRQEVSHGAE